MTLLNKNIKLLNQNFRLKVILMGCVFLTLLFCFLSCQKEVKIDIPAAEKHIVIEGAIEPNENAYVIISKSTGYFDQVDSSTLTNQLIGLLKNVVVTISDGQNTEKMFPTLDNSYFPPVIYKTNIMKGKIGGTYKLTVIADGKTYTSVASIPTPVALDSLRFKVNDATDSLGLLHARLSDPPGLGNCYKWAAKRISISKNKYRKGLTKDGRFYSPSRSAFDDKLVDGKSFDFDFIRGRNQFSTAADDTTRERRYFRKGDTIVVKFSSITKEVFEFYRSYEMQITSNGNPFASPSTIKSNIEGGAFGIWAGLGASLDTIVAK